MRHLARPARGGAAALVCVFAVGLWLASYAGMWGIPLAVILSSWFFKYAYVLFDHTVRGFDEPPVLDIHMVNPVNEQRPLAQIFILLLIGMFVKWVASISAPLAGEVAALFALLIVPASVCELGLEGNPIAAINPAALIRLVRGLGVLYLLVIAVACGYASLLYILSRWDPWRLIQIAVGMFAVLSLFSLLAGVSFERRHRLGLHTWRSPEQDAEKKAATDLRESKRLIAEAYGMVRVGAHGRASEAIRSWLSQRGNSAADYRWLCEQLVFWEDDRYISRYTQEFVEKLLTIGQRSEALDVVAKRVALDPQFRPASGRSTWTIAQLAACGGGRPKLARILLVDFADRYAGDAHCEAARALAQRLT